MKKDITGREIRRLALRQGLKVEVEIIPHHSGAKVRLWRLLDRYGRDPIGFAGGRDDDETLTLLRSGA